MKRGFLKGLLKSVGKGIVDAIPLVSTFKSNMADDHTGDGTGTGKVNWTRLVTAVVAVGLVAAFVFGKITMDDLKAILGLLPQ